jgi:hypothetical protein
MIIICLLKYSILIDEQLLKVYISI